MAIDLEQVVAYKEAYEQDYSARHSAHQKLRRYWAGEYELLQKDRAGGGSITSIFRDLGRHSGPSPTLNFEVHNNVIQRVCVKYQTFLSPLPMIRMYVDPPETSNRKRQAAEKERFLYGSWGSGKMSRRFREIAWYLPLMGDAFIGAFPDFDKSLAVPILRSPEVAYPIPGFDTDDESFVFHWKQRDSVLDASIPGYTPIRQKEREKVFLGLPRSRRGKPSDPMVDVYEWSDTDEFARWAGGQKVSGVEHSFGFNLFGHPKFIEVPGETWGHGAVEQAVNLNEVGDLLYSMLIAAVYENVFPSLVIKNPQGAPEEIVKGPGSVIPLQGDNSDAYYLQPATAGLQNQMGFLHANNQAIMAAGGMSDVDFGQSPVSSILTGAAVNELQGAGTGSTVEMVQGSLGLEMALWNEKAGIIQQTLFKDDKVTLYTSESRSSLDVNPRQGSVSLRGKELIGGWRNEVVFSPAMAQHDKLVMWLQAKGGGLVSDQYIREQIGIPDNEAMEEEIVGEEIQKAVLGFVLQTLQNPDQQQLVEEQAMAIVEGKQPVRAGAPPGGVPALPAQPGAPAGGPSGGRPTIPLGGGGVAAAKPLPLPPGAPQQLQGAPAGAPQDSPPAGAPTGAAPPAAPVTLQTALRALSKATLGGPAWLVGQIVAEGSAQTVEAAVTTADDKAALQQAAPFPLTVHLVSGEPQEQSVEIKSAA